MTGSTDLQRWGLGGVLWRGLLLVNLTTLALLPLGIAWTDAVIPAVAIVGGWLVSMVAAVAIKPAARGRAVADLLLRCWIVLIPMSAASSCGAVSWLRLELGYVEVLPADTQPDMSAIGASTGHAVRGHKTPDFNRSRYYMVVAPLRTPADDPKAPPRAWGMTHALGPAGEAWPKQARGELIAALGEPGRWSVDTVANAADLPQMAWAKAAVRYAEETHGVPKSDAPRFARLEGPEVDREAHRAWSLWGLVGGNMLFVLASLWARRRRLDPEVESR